MNYDDGFKPPLNPTPRQLWLQRRRDEIITYIDRSTTASFPISSEWIREYNSIITELKAMEQ
jgi:hypothetical protein